MGKKWVREHREEWNRYNRERYAKNVKSILTRRRLLYQKNRERILKTARERKEKLRRKALELFGNKCALCGGNKGMLFFHERNGKPHSYSNVPSLVLESPKDFVLLCRFPCHRFVHYCMDFLELTWEDIDRLKRRTL